MPLAEACRTALCSLVAREERMTGSRAIAYKNVARTVGASPSWVYKFCTRDPLAQEPRLSLFERIRLAYIAMCARIELEHQNELKKIEHLRGELNAVDRGFIGAVGARAPETHHA